MIYIVCRGQNYCVQNKNQWQSWHIINLEIDLIFFRLSLWVFLWAVFIQDFSNCSPRSFSTYKTGCIGVLRGDLIRVDYMLPSAVCVVVVGACLHNEYWELFWNIFIIFLTEIILILWIILVNFGQKYLKMVTLMWSKGTIKWLGSLQTKILK